MLVNLTRLDLHGNMIEKIQRLDALKHLRDLNLADNRITHITNIDLLTALETLNLEDNSIAAIPTSIQRNTRLSMVRLARNKISHLQDIASLTPLTNLSHLSIIGNPIDALPHCRAYVVYSCRTLSTLDGDRVLDAERGEAIARFDKSHVTSLEDENKALTQRLNVRIVLYCIVV